MDSEAIVHGCCDLAALQNIRMAGPKRAISSQPEDLIMTSHENDFSTIIINLGTPNVIQLIHNASREDPLSHLIPHRRQRRTKCA